MTNDPFARALEALLQAEHERLEQEEKDKRRSKKKKRNKRPSKRKHD